MKLFCKHDFRYTWSETVNRGRDRAHWFACKKCGKTKRFLAGSKRLERFLEKDRKKNGVKR